MGAGGIPSGGITKTYGRMGSLPRFGAKPNSRMDLYNDRGERVQSRWFDHNGIACRNRDYGEGAFGVHDHIWSTYSETYIDGNGVITAFIERGKDHLPADFIHYPTEGV